MAQNILLVSKIIKEVLGCVLFLHLFLPASGAFHELALFAGVRAAAERGLFLP